jgi:hypothetical protein
MHFLAHLQKVVGASAYAVKGDVEITEKVIVYLRFLYCTYTVLPEKRAINRLSASQLKSRNSKNKKQG